MFPHHVSVPGVLASVTRHKAFSIHLRQISRAEDISFNFHVGFLLIHHEHWSIYPYFLPLALVKQQIGPARGSWQNTRTAAEQCLHTVCLTNCPCKVQMAEECERTRSSNRHADTAMKLLNLDLHSTWTFQVLKPQKTLGDNVCQFVPSFQEPFC
jgi:hypothetical protein